MIQLRAAICALLVGLPAARAQGIITTIAGTDWFFQGQGRSAASAPLGRIERMAFDRDGNLYIADPDNSLILKVDPSGILSIAAGNGRPQFSGDNGPATAASVNRPQGVRADADGNIYIADTGNRRIRKVSNGIMSTFAGTGVYDFNGDGIPATSAALRQVTDMALDSDGNLYVCDLNRIRKITSATGLISTIAGAEDRGSSGDGGKAGSALLNQPAGLVIDLKNQIYIADTENNKVRRIDSSGIIQTVAGNGDFSPLADGVPATTVSIRQPAAIAVDSAGQLYIADTGHSRVSMVSAGGIITTVPGTSRCGFSGDAGSGPNATLSFPAGVAVDAQGNVFIADTFNRRVRRVASGTIASFAGNGGYKFGGDGGPAAAGLLDQPSGLAFDGKGNIYIADTQNQRVRKIDPSGIISTLAGDGFKRFGGDGGRATQASFDTPLGVAVDASGNVYIADSQNERVRKVDTSGIITTFAGGGADRSDTTTADKVSLLDPSYLTFDRAGNLYVSEVSGVRVRKITSLGAVSTYAGNGLSGSSGDGGSATAASLAYAGSLAFDSKSNLYIGERFYGLRVRKVSPDGIISTYAGNGLPCCSGDGGPATQAALDPTSLSLDSADNLFIGGQDRIRRVGTNGIVSTVAGGGPVLEGSIGDGGSALNALLRQVTGIGVDSSGNLYVTDGLNDRVRQVLNIAPPFQTSPNVLVFNATNGGIPAVEQTVLVTSSVTNLAFTAVPASMGGWLQITPQAGLAPGTIQVLADPRNLPPGDYEGIISVQAPTALPALRVVNVKFTVAPAGTPTLAAEPLDVVFDFVAGLPGEQRTLVVRNNGSGTIPFTVSSTTTSGGAWLSLNVSGGAVTATAPTHIGVAADPGKLSPGTYSGLISIVGGTPAQRLFVPVTMTIHSTSQTIVIPESGLTFQGVAGGAAQHGGFEVLNSGLGNLNWTATAEILSGGSNWLSTSPASGASGPGKTTAPQVQVNVDPARLSPGDYYGRVLIASPGAANSPQTVAIVFHVGPAGSAAVPDLRPTGVIFVALAGGQALPQDVILSNLGGASTAFRSTRVADTGPVFFTHQPTDGTLDPGQPIRISIQSAPPDATPGVRRGRITLEFTDGSTRVIEIVLVIPPAATAAAPNGVRATAGCRPTGLTMVFSLLGQRFQTPAAWPVPIEIKVADDCGTFLNNGTVLTSFSNGDPPLSLQPVGSGRWTATWQPGFSAAQVRVTGTAENAARTLEGITQVSGGVTPNASVPVLVPGSVFNAASFAARTPIAPGGLISIFGSNLSSGTMQSGVPRGTQLNSTLVVIGGVAAPLLYVSQTQVNAIVPFNLPINTSQQIVVQNNNSLTVPIPITIAPTQPAIFTVDGSGTGQGQIYSAAGLVNADHPAAAGDVLVIYCAGLGAVDQAVFDGFPAPANPLARTANPLTATVDGRPFEVLFAGLAPGFTGLYQVNVIVPSGVNPNNAAPVVFAVAGQMSPVVTMAVR